MSLAGMRAGCVYMSNACEVLVFSGDPDLLRFSLHLVDTHTGPHTYFGHCHSPRGSPLAHTDIYTRSLSLAHSL